MSQSSGKGQEQAVVRAPFVLRAPGACSRGWSRAPSAQTSLKALANVADNLTLAHATAYFIRFISLIYARRICDKPWLPIQVGEMLIPERPPPREADILADPVRSASSQPAACRLLVAWSRPYEVCTSLRLI